MSKENKTRCEHLIPMAWKSNRRCAVSARPGSKYCYRHQPELLGFGDLKFTPPKEGEYKP